MTTLKDTYRDSENIVRWLSNDRIPPKDLLEEFGMVADELVKHVKLHDDESLATILQYCENQKNMSNEEKSELDFELSATFGPGEKVVNVFTGEVHYT